MKIFVTGASGFVGGAIVEELRKTGHHEVLAMSRGTSSDEVIQKRGARPVRAELGNVRPELLRGCAVVIHCAAFVGPWGSRQDFWQGNVEGTRQLLEAAREAGVGRFIHMGTEAALFAGQDLINIDEDQPYPRHNPYLYGETKAEAEKLVLAANNSGFETIVLRPRMVWGPGDTSILPVLKTMIADGKFLWLDGGRAKTSTTCILNLTHAVSLALDRGVPGHAYFITDDEIHTFREFLTEMLATQNIAVPAKSVPGWLAGGLAAVVEGLWRLFHIRAEPPLMRFATDVMRRECTIRVERATRELGYRPRVSVAQGLAAMRAG